VHPELRERPLPGVRGFTLSDFIFVVGEDEIHPTGVNVEAVAEVVAAHRRALDVPPGTPATPRALRAPLVLRAALPQREIQRIVLVAVFFNARAGDQVVDFAA